MDPLRAGIPMLAFHAQPLSSQCENEGSPIFPGASPWKLVAISVRTEESCFHGMVLGQFVRGKCTHSCFTHDGFRQRHLLLGNIVN